VFTFAVADNGQPPLSEQRSVTLVVVSQPVIQSITNNSGTVTIQWSAFAGVRYGMQFKTSLLQADWTDLPGDVTATGPTAARSDSPGGFQRFYRVLALP
jgi:hypothetical protein